MYALVAIMLLQASYAVGQGIELYDGIKSGDSKINKKLYYFGEHEFIIGTYDRDKGIIYAVYFTSIKHYPPDSMSVRDSNMREVKNALIKDFGEPGLSRDGPYLPFLGYNQTFTLYAWYNKGRIIMLNLFGRKDNNNIIKIEIYDSNML